MGQSINYYLEIKQIFNPGDAEEVSFPDGWKEYKFLGGRLLTRGDFEQIKLILSSIGDENLYIIERRINSMGESLRISGSISWNDLVSEKFVRDLLTSPVGVYYLFSDSLNWGLYCNNDEREPFILLGILPELDHIFSRYKSLQQPLG